MRASVLFWQQIDLGLAEIKTSEVALCLPVQRGWQLSCQLAP
jgi:hypothetical protein